MPTKPSKFSTEALSKIDTTAFDPDCKCASCKERFAKAAELVDQSFAPARTAFEELVKAAELFHGEQPHGHGNELAHKLAAAQKILKEWDGE